MSIDIFFTRLRPFAEILLIIKALYFKIGFGAFFAGFKGGGPITKIGGFSSIFH